MQHHHLHDRLDVYCSFTLSLRHWCLMQHHPLYDRLMFTAASPFIWQTRVYCSITLSPDRLVAGGQVVQHQTVQTWNCITSSSSSRITSPGTLTTKKSERENFTSLSWKQVLEGFKFWSDLLLLAKLIKTQAAEEHFFSVAKGRQKSVLCCPVAQTVCLHRGTERIGLLGLGNDQWMNCSESKESLLHFGTNFCARQMLFCILPCFSHILFHRGSLVSSQISPWHWWLVSGPSGWQWMVWPGPGPYIGHRGDHMTSACCTWHQSAMDLHQLHQLQPKYNWLVSLPLTA